MTYRLECDGCDLDRTAAEWPDANRLARDHEARHGDHWVTIVESPTA